MSLQNWWSVKADEFFVRCPRGPETMLWYPWYICHDGGSVLSAGVSTQAKLGHLPTLLTTTSQSLYGHAELSIGPEKPPGLLGVINVQDRYEWNISNYPS